MSKTPAPRGGSDGRGGSQAETIVAYLAVPVLGSVVVFAFYALVRQSVDTGLTKAAWFFVFAFALQAVRFAIARKRNQLNS